MFAPVDSCNASTPGQPSGRLNGERGNNPGRLYFRLLILVRRLSLVRSARFFLVQSLESHSMVTEGNSSTVKRGPGEQEVPYAL